MRVDERGKSAALKMKTPRSYSEVPRWELAITKDATSLPRTLGIEKRNRLCALRFASGLPFGQSYPTKTRRVFFGAFRSPERGTHMKIKKVPSAEDKGRWTKQEFCYYLRIVP